MGEWLTVRVNGRPTEQRLNWTEFGDLVQLDLDVASLSPGALPEAFALEQNYPNPFNPATTVRYQLPHEADVALVIYSLTGQVVRRLVQGKQQAGSYAVSWDGRAQDGRPVSSGIYIYRLRAGDFDQTHKLVLAK